MMRCRISLFGSGHKTNYDSCHRAPRHVDDDDGRRKLVQKVLGAHAASLSGGHLKRAIHIDGTNIAQDVIWTQFWRIRCGCHDAKRIL